MTQKDRKLGDFSGLADDFAKYRPDYSKDVLNGILGVVGMPVLEIDAVDLGAGTGIWTRMLVERGLRKVVAIEPNDEMRTEGARLVAGPTVNWFAGSGERTGLPVACCDLVTMASSFHWVNFDAAVREFQRILRPNGCFAALWNPRYIEASPLLMEIEAHLNSLRPGMQRVSSGRSGITEGLTERLEECGGFSRVVYLEGKHVLKFSPERYLGAWRSVNDIRAQLGESGFAEFLKYVERKIVGLEEISATYLTRAWVARRA